jgi:hypothetical protein
MKPDKLIAKIQTQLVNHTNIINKLLIDLEVSYEDEREKERQALITKIATHFNLDTDDIIKKLPKKRKTKQAVQSEAETILAEQAPIFKKVEIGKKVYYCETHEKGIVLHKNKKSSIMEIVGYMKNEEIIFDSSLKY